MTDDKIVEFMRIYREVFSISDSVSLCGRETCKKLILLCNELGTDDYGNPATGFMNTEHIHELHDKLLLSSSGK